MKFHEMTFTPAETDIDVLGHVNNAVFVRWIQEVATAHWNAVAPRKQREALVWVVTRHEIDYLRSVGPGESVIARTWVADRPEGARFDRFIEFRGDDGKPRVKARTTWALIDRASRRPMRITPDIAAPFLG